MPNVHLELDATQLAALRRKLDTVVPPALEHLVKDSGPYIREQASSNAPRATGALASSLVSEGRGLEARVYSPLDYALPQEFGRHGGSVTATPGRGASGRFFLRRAVQMFLSTELPRLWQKAIDELERAWSG